MSSAGVFLINGLNQKRALPYSPTILASGYWPFQGIVYSLLVHTMLFSGALWLSVSDGFFESAPRTARTERVDSIDLRQVIYLPVLGGGDAGQSPGELEAGEEAPSVASVRSPEGLTYPGPQPILSEFPDATNSSQTVLQPSLEDPEVLEPPLSLPNVIQRANAEAIVQVDQPLRDVLIAPVLEPQSLDPFLLAADLAALAPERNAVEPLPSESLALALPERSLEPVAAGDLSGLAADRSPVQPLPARPVDLALPTRPLAPVAAGDLGGLAAKRSPVQPLPARPVDLALPTRALAPVGAGDLSGLAADRGGVQPLPGRGVDLALPERSLPPVETSDVGVLATERGSVQPLPGRGVGPALPTRALAPVEAGDVDALATERGSAQPLPGRGVAPALPTRSLAPVEAGDVGALATERGSFQPFPVDGVGPGLPTRALSGPRSMQLSDLAAVFGSDRRDLLALSPMPGAAPVELPPGVARGLFATSPTPNLTTDAVRPGGTADPSADAVADERPAGDSGLNADRVADANGAAATGDGGGGDASLPGGGGADDDNGAGMDPESGSRSAPGDDAFPGVTILASTAETGAAAGPDAPDATDATDATDTTDAPDVNDERPQPFQRSYGVSVLTTETSGGGLPRFGVFSDEQVHTVFFDMREKIGDPAPAWTVEYGVPQGARVRANSGSADDGPTQGFLLPFPVDRRQPAFPPDLVHIHRQRMIIAYAVIDVDGKMHDVSVKETPDPALVQPVLDALAQWTFRPARLNGAPVPLKVLLGIPIWAK